MVNCELRFFLERNFFAVIIVCFTGFNYFAFDKMEGQNVHIAPSRPNESEEQAEIRRQRNRERMRLLRANRRLHQANAQRNVEADQVIGPPPDILQRINNAERQRKHRANMLPEQAAARRQVEAERQREHRAIEPPKKLMFVVNVMFNDIDKIDHVIRQDN